MASSPEWIAPTVHIDSAEHEQMFGAATTIIRELGASVVHICAEINQVPEVIEEFDNPAVLAEVLSNEELRATIEARYADRITGLGEKITTVDDFMNVLVLGKPVSRKIIDGYVVDARGIPIVHTVARGKEVARKTAEVDADFVPQLECEELNLAFAQTVDSLEVGERAVGLSMDPKERLMAFEDPNNNRLTELGYRLGMAAFHIAYRVSEDEMLLWAVYIKETDKESLSMAMKALFDHDIPADTHSDEWLGFVHRSFVDRDSALRTGSDLIELHKKQIGSEEGSYSVDEFLQEEQQITWDWFVRYDVPLAVANATGRNNAVMKNLAMTLLQNVKGFSAEVRQKLIRVANSDRFDDESTRIMDKVVEYALQEELLTRLPDFMKRKDAARIFEQKIVQPQDVVFTFVRSRDLEINQLAYVQQINHMNRHEQDMLAAQRMQIGITAKRSSGGCAGTGGALFERDGDNPLLQNNIFGKLDGVDSERTVRMGRDGKGPLDFQCTKGHWNTREDGKPLVPHCKVCKESVGCAPPEKKSKNSAKTNVFSLFGGDELVKNKKLKERAERRGGIIPLFNNAGNREPATERQAA
jgi:hypothetical protein